MGDYGKRIKLAQCAHLSLGLLAAQSGADL